MLRGDIINVALHRYVYREVTAMIDAKTVMLMAGSPARGST